MRIFALPFALGLLISPIAQARASTQVEAEAEPPPRGSESRFRVGLDFVATGGTVFSPNCNEGCSSGLAAAGLGLELGYQADRSWGVFIRSEAGTTLISNYAGSYLMLEHTPLPQLSFAAGAGVEGVLNFFGYDYGGVAFPVRLSWNFLSEDTWEARRGNDTWRLSLAFVGGSGFAQGQGSDAFFRAALSIGFAWI